MCGHQLLVGQLVRYALVGFTSNAALFAGFLLLVHLGLSATVSMTVLYATGVALTFALNRRWTFRHAGHARRPLVRFVLSHLSCYGLNLLLLNVLVDRLQWPAAPVQAGAILLIALLLFLLQKFWVFREAGPTTRE